MPKSREKNMRLRGLRKEWMEGPQVDRRSASVSDAKCSPSMYGRFPMVSIKELPVGCGTLKGP